MDELKGTMMNAPVKSRVAIEELARAVAAQFLSERSNDQSIEEPDEFLSAIELEVRSTLRDQLEKMVTLREVEETPTLDPSSNSGMDMTLDPHYDAIGATLDPSSNEDYSLDMPTMDSASPELNPSQSYSVKPGASSKVSAGRVSAGKVSSGKVAISGKRSSKTKHTPKSASEVSAPVGYEIISTLGKGGMGVVYKAKHIPLDRTVAVKMIISGAHASDEQIRRFQSEAEAAAHLSHPNIVSVYEIGEHNGLPYFSLEFVEGTCMSDLMRETTMSPKEAAQLLLPVARAIEYSHEMGVLHRDLKPQNILISKEGVPKVADFGLAKRLDTEEGQTMTGVIVGTPGYLAPEQASDTRKVGRHTDVYALGCILYYMMTGRPPFKAPTPIEAVRQLLFNEPLPPSQLQTSLDKDLETICMKALEKEIPKRYATAGLFADELERFVNDEPILARPITRKERLWKWCRRNPRVATLSGVVGSLLMFLLVGGLAAAAVFNSQKKQEMQARELAEKNELLANDQAEIARNASRIVIYKTKDFFEEHPELAPLRKDMLDAIAKDMERIHVDRYGEGATDTMQAAATNQLGRIYLSTGEYDRAIKSLLDAEAQLTKLNADGKLPRASVSQMDLSIAIGDTYREMGDLSKAEKRYLQTYDLRKKYLGQRKGQISNLMQRQSMSEVYGRLYQVYTAMGKPELMLKYALLSSDARREWWESNKASLLRMEELSGALGNLSVAYERLGQLEKMVETSAEMLGLSALISKHKSDFRTRHNVATQQKMLARQSLVIGKVDRSRSLLEQAVATFDDLTELSPENRKMIAQAADSNYLHGLVLSRVGEDAEASFDKAAKLQRSLIEKSNNINTQGMLLKILARAGKVDEAKAMADEIAKKSDNIYHCGYAGCAYAMLSQHLPEGEKDEAIKKSISLIQAMVQKGYHDFEAMRKTDPDFEALQNNAEFLKMLDAEESRLKEEAESKADSKQDKETLSGTQSSATSEALLS